MRNQKENKITKSKEVSPAQRGKAAARVMLKELRAEHARWNLPLLSWEKGRVTSSEP